MRPLLGAAAAVAVTLLLPARLAGIGTSAWFDDDLERADRLAEGVEGWLAGDLDRAGFSTGSALYDGEWLFGSYQMAGIAFGQLALAHPAHRGRHVASLERAIDGLLSEDVRAFDAERWGSDPLADLDSGANHHAAYLGYTGIVLGLHRVLVPDSEYADVHDAVAEALHDWLVDCEIGLLLTYPGEVYPVDNTAVLATLALHERATGAQHAEVVAATVERMRARWVDPSTGLLIQAVDYRTGEPLDAPRGSGTALGSQFVSFADPAFARELAEAVREELAGDLLGFGLVREYPRGHGGRGDIDSGPVLLGWGVSATGFSVASARLLGDDDWGRRNMRTAQLFGAPVREADSVTFATGGPLGNALMLAMLTTAPLEPTP